MKIIKIVFILLGAICITAASAQTLKIDSLEKVLAKHPRTDKAKVDLLINIASECSTQDQQKARGYADQISKLSTELNYEKGKAGCLWVNGLISKASDKKKALSYYEKALELAEGINDKAGMSKYLLSIGGVAKELGEMKKSDDSYDKALKIATQIQDKKLIIAAMSNISWNLRDKGKFLESSELARKAVRIAEEIDDKEQLSFAYKTLGLAYFRLGVYDKSLEYSLSSLRIEEQLDNKNNIVKLLLFMGGINYDQNEFEGALGKIERAFEISKNLNDSALISVCLINKGNILQIMNKPEALNYFQEALATGGDKVITQKINLLTSIAAIYTSQGKFGLAQKKLNEAVDLAQKHHLKYYNCEVWEELAKLHLAQKQYSQAISYSRKIVDLATEINYLKFQLKGYKQLSDLYVEVGDYKNAYLNYTLFKVASDSTFNEKNTREIALLESSYKFEKEIQKYELESANNLLKIKNQKHIIISLVAVSILILIMLLILYKTNKLKKKVLQLKIENVNHELEYSQKEMAAAALKLVQSSESDAYCVKMLENIKNNTSEEGEKEASSLINYYKNKSLYSNWEEFETLFIKVNGTFYDKLNERFPTLTPNEKKLCVFLKLNMSNKDIAQITFQSEEALKKARLRLRKKLDIDREVNLATFIQGL